MGELACKLVLLRFSGSQYSRLCCAGVPSLSGAQGPNSRWQEGKKDDHSNYPMDALTDVGYERSEEVAAQGKTARPAAAPNDVISEVTGIAHAGRTSHGGTEGPHDGHESSEDHRLAAVAFVELMRAFEMAPLEEKRVFAPVQRLSCPPANPVANLVPNDGADDYERDQAADF